MARNRHKKQAAEVLQGPTAAELAENEQTAAVSFPLERTSLPAELTYYCAAATCPGLPTEASEAHPHPENTCGSLVSHMPRSTGDTLVPPSGVEAHEMPPITTTDNEKPEPPAEFSAENLSTVLERQLPTEAAPEAFAEASVIVPDPQIPEETPPSPEPPPLPDNDEGPINPAIPEAETPAPEIPPEPKIELVEKRVYAAKDVPSPVDSAFRIEHVGGNGVLSISILDPEYTPQIRFANVHESCFRKDVRPLEPEEFPEWIHIMLDSLELHEAAQRTREKILSSFDSGGLEAVSRLVAELAPAPAPSPEPTMNELPSELNSAIDELRLETGVSGWQIIRVIDSVLRTITQVLSASQTLESSPLVSAILSRGRALLESGKLRPLLLEQLKGTVDELISVNIADMRTDLERETQAKLVEIERLHSEHLEELTKAHEDLEGLAGADPDDVDRLEKRVKDLEKSKALVIVKDDLEALGKSLAHLEKRFDKVDARTAKDWRKPTLRATSKAEPKPRKQQKKRQSRRYEQLPLSPNLMPTKAKTRGKGRPPKGYWESIGAFMGKAKSAKIRELLGKLTPPQLAKFLAEARSGQPSLGHLPWTSAEMVKFSTWFYAHPKR